MPYEGPLILLFRLLGIGIVKEGFQYEKWMIGLRTFVLVSGKK